MKAELVYQLMARQRWKSKFGNRSELPTNEVAVMKWMVEILKFKIKGTTQ